jgi:hypothetical protein
MGRTERKNVFVVGAGASAEFMLPTGRGLLDKISRLVSTRYDRSTNSVNRKCPDDVRDALSLYSRSSKQANPTNNDLNKLIDDAAWICQNCSLAPSIDNLLHAHSNDPDVVAAGKILIVKSLIDEEKKSILFPTVNGMSLFSSMKKNEHGKEFRPAWSWLGELFWLLVEQRNYREFLEAVQNITYISFNYDRCIEHFIVNAAISYFKLDGSAVSELIQSISIIRPYGTLGDLVQTDQYFSGFGELRGNIYSTSKGLRTYTEGIADAMKANLIHEAFSNADLVFFLGFGYLNLNLDILLGDKKYMVQKVFGTRLGLSDESTKILTNKLSKSFLSEVGPVRIRNGEAEKYIPAPVELSNVTCQELLQKHQFFLRE